jgi:Raf kinase inhibitor-like YbhB/YbcL family protein
MTAMLQLTSTAFEPGASIPSILTCEGKDLSPPLAWSGVPQASKTLALIIDDPDAPDPTAPRMTWVHWVLYNIPADVTRLDQGASRQPLPPGTLQGRNDWKRAGYGGPCPPVGRHRYFHKLYALDVVLPDLALPTKDRLLQAMTGHILAHAELIGTYEKVR